MTLYWALAISVRLVLVSAMRLDGDRELYGAREDPVPELTPGIHFYYEEKMSVQEKMMEGLGCYCKQVADLSECPDFKTGKHSQMPDRLRWFHGHLMEGKKPHLCCKLEKDVWYNRVGWGYERQGNSKFCTMEVRPVPEDVCCRQEGLHGNATIGLHVKQVTLQGYQRIPLYKFQEKNYGKSYPLYTLRDIRGATDYDGTAVSAEKVREFLLDKVKSGFLLDFEKDENVHLSCMPELYKDKEDCRLRSNNAECCCLQASIDPAERCLPVSGGSSNAEPVVITGTYTEKKHHGVKDGSITWVAGLPEASEQGMPASVNFRDPMATNELTFEWIKATQWKRECMANQTVGYSTHRKVRTGTRRMGKMSVPIKTTRYTQHHRIECISYRYTRTCPVGQGLYVKQFPQGTCAVPGSGKELQLEKAGSISFQCPEGYVSGTAGGMKFNSNCRCTEC